MSGMKAILRLAQLFGVAEEDEDAVAKFYSEVVPTLPKGERETLAAALLSPDAESETWAHAAEIARVFRRRSTRETLTGRFTVRKSGGQFVFTLYASNGEAILVSERYVRKVDAINGIEAVRASAEEGARYEKRTSKANQPYFVLKTANNEIIGTSEMYSSEAARDAGIASVKASAPAATTDVQAT